MLAQGSVCNGHSSRLFTDRCHRRPAALRERGKVAIRGSNWLHRAPALVLAAGAAAFAQEPPATLPGVVVESMAPPPALRRIEINTLSNAPMAETPITAGVVTAEEIANRGVQTLSQAIRDQPSAGDGYNTIGFIETLVVRGFRLDSLLNYRRDGVPISNYTPLAVFNLEAIEIVNGPASVVGGAGTPGGLVNYRIKRPTETALAMLSAEVSERGTVLLQGDFGGRFGDGGAFGYRINAAAEERRPYPIDADGRRGFVSGWFDWRPGPKTTLVAEFDYNAVRQISVPGYGLMAVDDEDRGTVLPAPITPRQNLNSQPWSLPFESRAVAGSLRWLQQLGGSWRFELLAGGQNITTNDRIAFPDGCSAGPVYVYPGICANGDVDIYDYRSNDERRRIGTLDALLAGTATTGAVRHELRFNARHTRASERFPPLQTYNFVGISNVYAPVVLPDDPTPNVLNPELSQTVSELAASDVMRAGPGSLWLGGRWVRLQRSSALSDGSEAVSFDQRVLVPWAALGWQPWAGGFAYASYSKGVEIEVVPSRADQFVNYGAALPALKSTQVEVGFKQVAAGGDAFTLALFSIDKPYGDDIELPDGRLLRVAGAREARHRGLEASGVVGIGPALRVEARAAWIDARTTKAIDPELVGKRTTNVAPFAASLSAAWQVPGAPGLELSSLFLYSAAKPVLPDNSVELSPYWQWDLAASYRWLWSGYRMTLRGGIENVTNTLYWREAPTEAWGGTYLFPAQPRLFRLALAASW
jgi:iron complex outermembrane receptor protein